MLLSNSPGQNVIVLINKIMNKNNDKRGRGGRRSRTGPRIRTPTKRSRYELN